MCQLDLHRLCAKDDAIAAAATRLRVRNALTGDALCEVEVDAGALVRRLASQITAATGIHELEQRLFVNKGGCGGIEAKTIDIASRCSIRETLEGAEQLMLLRVAMPRDEGAEGLEPGAVLVDAARGSRPVARWAVDASILDSRSTPHVSPMFKLDLGAAGTADFKLMMTPSRASSFQKAQGRGQVHLKCQSALDATVSFAISVSGVVGGSHPELHDHDFGLHSVWKREHTPIDAEAITTMANPSFGQPRKVVVVRVEVLGCAPNDRAMQ